MVIYGCGGFLTHGGTPQIIQVMDLCNFGIEANSKLGIPILGKPRYLWILWESTGCTNQLHLRLDGLQSLKSRGTPWVEGQSSQYSDDQSVFIIDNEIWLCPRCPKIPCLSLINFPIETAILWYPPFWENLICLFLWQLPEFLVPCWY
jgi:hypothetical protein